MAASHHLPGYRAVQVLSAAVALACLVAGGCSGQTSAGPAAARRPAGTISGTLVLEYSTACTGAQVLCAVLNLPGRGRLEIVAGSRVVASVVTGPSGGFRVRVPAGRYRLRLVAPVRYSCTADTPPARQTFTVRPGRVSQLQVFCQAGRYGSRRSR